MLLLREMLLATGRSREWIFARNTVSRSVRLAVLISFLVTTVGIPVGDWSTKTTNAESATSAGCRCSTEARRAGRCCCAKSPAGAMKSGCCSSRPTTANASSCCSKKKAAEAKLASHPAPGEQEEPPMWRGECPCGPTDSPMLLVCAQPRILTEATNLFDISTRSGSHRALSVATCGQRLRPLVPPPEPVFVG